MKKTYIQTDEIFEAALQKLKDQNPGFSGSILIRLCVLRMAEMNMKVAFGSIEPTTTEAVERRKKAQPKDQWCSMFGGVEKDGVCTIDKYETMPTGHVRKSKRVMALDAFPVDRDDFQKSVLGHFDSVEAAEEAYKAKPLQ